MARTSRRNRISDRRLILRIVIIVFLVIFIFEGQLLYTMFTFKPSGVTVTREDSSVETEETASAKAGTSSSADTSSDDTSSAGTSSAGSSSAGAGSSSLAGLTDTNEKEAAVSEALPTVSNPDSSAIVPRQPTPVDDSYFSDAVFIGDSRMEGFRNSSGITTGTFLTSVGMSLSSMANSAIISTSSGSVTVPAALSGGKYGKIYVMLGANDLGTYDWDEFKEGFAAVLERFHEIQPKAIIYVCSCIYVEEDKVTTGDYVNNANADILNDILLQVCEEEGFYYLDLNEVLSNGSGALIEGASADGVHLNQEYCEAMLNYMKTHYIPVDDEKETESENETETEAGSGEEKGEA